jgi:hypothetical protein
MPASSSVNNQEDLMEQDNIQKKVDESWKEKSTNVEKDFDQALPDKMEPDFKFFLTTLGMQAWIAMGILPNPMTEKTEENMNQAKYIIDCLELLEKKTKGNLDQEENDLLENLLYELRLGFVSKTKKEGTA